MTEEIQRVFMLNYQIYNSQPIIISIRYKYYLYSHSSVNACLLPICSVDELAITTIEGIGSTRSKLHPCQVHVYDEHEYTYKYINYRSV